LHSKKRVNEDKEEEKHCYVNEVHDRSLDYIDNNLHALHGSQKPGYSQDPEGPKYPDCSKGR